MERLKSALETWLPDQLPGLRLDFNPLRRGSKLSGVVVWQGFDGLEPIDRQNLLWSKLQTHFSREDQLRISLLITLTPAEYAVYREPQLA